MNKKIPKTLYLLFVNTIAFNIFKAFQGRMSFVFRVARDWVSSLYSREAYFFLMTKYSSCTHGVVIQDYIAEH
ncbi:MAG: hypothetical protein LBT08_00875, partial [Synergistaceae bacterium]|nr:hypothetical protein [Synergistaceae bacterium]